MINVVYVWEVIYIIGVLITLVIGVIGVVGSCIIFRDNKYSAHIVYGVYVMILGIALSSVYNWII